MAGWRVVLSPEFNTALNTTARNFYTAQIGATSRTELDRAHRRSLGFDRFLTAILDLRDGHVSPEKVLKLFGETAAGQPVYVLPVGRWQCIFIVDHEKRICTAVGMVEASLSGRVRARLGPYLS